MLTYPKKQIVFSQGDAADAVFYIHEGQIKLSKVVTFLEKDALPSN